MLTPEGCRPILVADAGFRSTWFMQVEAIGWHWVGRIRGRTLVAAKKGVGVKYPSFDGHLITGTMPQEVLREQASKVFQGI